MPQLDHGYIAPADSDLIRDGADAISTNAHNCLRLWGDVDSLTTRTNGYLSDDGDPRGNITLARPGMVYVDTAATRGAVLWRNDGTNPGSPEWRCISGDTGWIDIIWADVIPDEIADVDEVSIRRVNQRAYISLQFTFTDTPDHVYTDPVIPDGFMGAGVSNPTFHWLPLFSQTSNGDLAGSMSIQPNGRARIYPKTTGDEVKLIHSWLTDDPWPEHLPSRPNS